MPRVNVPVVTPGRAGVSLGAAGTEVTGDVANDHEMANSGNELLVVRNSGGSEYDVTIITQTTADGEAVPDKVVAVPAAQSKIIGPFPPVVYNTAEGKLQIDVENAALMLQAFRA